MQKQRFLLNFQGVPEEKVVTYIAAEGDISTDLLSPGESNSFTFLTVNYTENV